MIPPSTLAPGSLRGDAPPADDPGPDPAPWTRFPDILRTWFWRFYDHLGRLILYNLLWFFGLWALIGVAARTPVLYWPLFYLVACAYSLAWAYLVFRIILTGAGPLREAAAGWKRFALRALLLTLITGVLIVLGMLNLGFYLKWQGGWRFVGWVLTGVTVWLLLFWAGAALYQWPILFFQDIPFWKVLTRSFLLFMDNSGVVILSLFMGALLTVAFTLTMLPWMLLGPAFFFSFQCVALEKHLLRYRITYQDAPLGEVLERLEKERHRTWREFFRPWEAK